MKCYLSNFESYYYIVRKLYFKRLFLKYSNFIGRFKNFIKPLESILESAEDVIVDITPYKEVEEYEYKVEALYNFDNVRLVSKEDNLDLIYSNKWIDTLHIGNEVMGNLTPKVIMPYGSLNVPIHLYSQLYGLIYGGWVFFKKEKLLFKNGWLYNLGLKYDHVKVSQNLEKNLLEIKKYFDYLE